MKTLFILVLSLIGCGRQHDTSSTPASTPPAASPAPQAAEGQCGMTTTCIIRGGLAGAFSLSVDGRSYSDIESFYSFEVEDLKKQAAANGYEDADFSGQLGLSDYQYGMKAYIENTSGKGYAGSTDVDGNGQFMVHDVNPTDTPDSLFNVRLNKRITLTAGDAKFCWNLSGQASDVQVNSAVIINTYTTSFTLYSCTDHTSGMSIPPLPAKTK